MEQLCIADVHELERILSGSKLNTEYEEFLMKIISYVCENAYMEL